MQKQLQFFTFNDPLAMKTVKCTRVSSLVGVAFLVFKIFPLFSFPQISLSTHGLYIVHGHHKI